MSLDVFLEESCDKCGHRWTWDGNVTHNLGEMATEAGVYGVVWRPAEHGISRAADMILPLSNAIRAMEKDPERFKKLNPENGWGDFSGFQIFLGDYLRACVAHPNAVITVER